MDVSDDVDLRGYVSRRQVAELLEMSASGVRKYEDSWFKGLQIKHRNTTYYPRRVVEEFLATRGDRKAYLCFAAFRAGRLPTELIASTEGLKPRLAQLYFQQYLEIRRDETGSVVLDTDPTTHSATWLHVHGFGETPPSAQYIRAALELCALTPELHQKVLKRAKLAEDRLRSTTRAGQGSEGEAAE